MDGNPILVFVLIGAVVALLGALSMMDDYGDCP